MKLYKTLMNGKSCNGGNYEYKKGEWSPVIKETKMCEKGYHLTTNPFKWLESANEVWEAEGKNQKEVQEDKVLFESVKIVKELTSKDLVALKKEIMPFKEKEFADSLGNIPTKNDVVALRKRIEDIEWFKAQSPDKKSVSAKVKLILDAFKISFSCEIEYHKLDSASAWDSAWYSARNSAWDSARNSARYSARDPARYSAWDSAWGSARNSAWYSARNSARYSAWDSARDSARACEFEVVKDLMKAKGYDKNPFNELLDLWRMGLYPIGVLKDKKFHIYYVPLKEGREKSGVVKGEKR